MNTIPKDHAALALASAIALASLLSLMHSLGDAAGAALYASGVLI